jgi:2-polyprenyl-3-methyl-5-hydroxy-6-metoxy-1,4-benzoquinol methylase
MACAENERGDKIMNHYLFDNTGSQTPQRFNSLEVLYDPATIRYLEARNVTAGWRCLEVGGGGGSIAAWLARQVGPTGHVLVTDVDPRYLTAATLDSPQLDIQQHNIATDPLPVEAYDLVHARLVLMHVPTPEQALAKLVAALKPGGWLVVEDFDPTFVDRSFPTEDSTGRALFQKMLAALLQLRAARGNDIGGWGRHLYTRLRGHGLREVGMEGHLAIWPGSSAGAQLDHANFEQARTEAVARGLISEEEIEQILVWLENPMFAVSSPMMFTAWGRRPT